MAADTLGAAIMNLLVSPKEVLLRYIQLKQFLILAAKHEKLFMIFLDIYGKLFKFPILFDFETSLVDAPFLINIQIEVAGIYSSDGMQVKIYTYSSTSNQRYEI